MATSGMIEEDRGTFSGFYRMHNGYYVGDFSHRTHSAAEATGLEQVLLPQLPVLRPRKNGRSGRPE